MTLKVVKREAVYIPINGITNATKDRIKKRLTFDFFGKEKICEGCEWFAERVNDVCQSCANYKGGYELATQVKVGVKNKKYLKIPVGSSPGIFKMLGRTTEVKVVDKSPKTEIAPVKFRASFKSGQAEAVADLLRMKRGVLRAPPRSGKCVDGATVIYTSNGPVRIDSLFKGIQLNEAGSTECQPSTPVKIQTSEGLKDVARLYSKVVDRTVRITTVYGKSVRGTENHPIQVARAGCHLEWVPLSKVKPGDYVVSNSNNAWHGKRTTLLEPSDGLHKYLKPGTSNLIWHTQIPTELTEELAALMGMLVADGRLQNGNSLGFSNTDPKKLRKFRRLWATCFPKHTLKESRDPTRATYLSVCSKQIKLFFEKSCGFAQVLAGQKTMPKILMTAPRKFVLSFLAGYMSCDGEFTKAGVGFSSASFKFARQLSSVLTALGYRNSALRKPVNINLSHKTIGDRVGKYGMCSMKRYVFDQLAEELPFLVRTIQESDSRSIDQDDEIPFLRGTLHTMSRARQRRLGNSYVWVTDSDKQLPVGSVGTMLRDKRGRGRGPHMNRAVSEQLHGSTISSAVDWNLIRRISPTEHRRLKEFASLSFERVDTVKRIVSPMRVYDVHVPGPENFFGNGILNHNTVMGTAAICALQKKTLILASQRDWLMGFYETFVGSDTQPAMTNLKKRRIKLCKTLDDFLTHDVCLATVQTFYSPNGERLLAKLRDVFQVILIDEVHTAAADKYLQIVAKLNTEYMFGFSGTPQRKDEREVLVANVVGPIIHSMEVKQVRPRVKLTRTGYSKEVKGQQQWVRMVSHLENDKKRIDVIAKQAIRDVKDGHMVLIPVAQVKPIKKIVDRINELADTELGFAFTGSLKKTLRDQYIQDARDYKIKILVGTQKILSVGINIPRASCLFEIVMSSNLPNAEQRMARVLTPMEGKPESVIRFFLDDMGVRRNCMRNEFYRVLLPKFNPIISANDKEMIEAYFKAKGTNVKKFDL